MSQIIQIPLDNGAPMPFFDMQAVLDGVTYTLQVRWNPVDAHWYMDVLDESGQTYLRAGLKLVCNWPLGAYRAERIPAGVLIAVDSSGKDVDPTLTDLGVRVKLLYITADELGA